MFRGHTSEPDAYPDRCWSLLTAVVDLGVSQTLLSPFLPPKELCGMLSPTPRRRSLPEPGERGAPSGECSVRARR
jgi:hypothetical protein